VLAGEGSAIAAAAEVAAISLQNDLVAVAGGWHLRTRKQFADAIHLAMGGPRLQPLSCTENLVLTAIAYFQPITRGQLPQLFGKAVSRDVIGQLFSRFSLFRFLPVGAFPTNPTK
jgi:chromosome segregation and condensation protein ScpB